MNGGIRAVGAMLALLLLAGCRPAPDCRVREGRSEQRQASAGCVILRNDHMLVLEHRFSGKLGLPGGGRKGGESAQCTAHRETYEETGLDVRVGRRLGLLHKGFTVYHCRADAGADAAPPSSAWLEVRDLQWHKPDSLKREQWRHADELAPLVEMIKRGGEEDQ